MYHNICKIGSKIFATLNYLNTAEAATVSIAFQNSSTTVIDDINVAPKIYTLKILYVQNFIQQHLDDKKFLHYDNENRRDLLHQKVYQSWNHINTLKAV